MILSKESVYVAATPYHILLSLCIASFRDVSKKKYLVIVSDFKDAQLLNKVILQWASNPFDEVILLDGRYGKKSVIDRFSTIRNNIHGLSNFVKEKITSQFNAYVCNIEQPEGQFIAYNCKKSGGTVSYIEDGIGAYLQGYRKEPLCKELFKKFAYGPWYENASSHTASRYIDAVIVLRPDLLKNKIKNKEIIAFPTSFFARLSKTGFQDELFLAYGIVMGPDWDVFVLVPNSKVAEKLSFEKIKKFYSAIISRFAAKNKYVMVKYHPREGLENFLDIKKNKFIQIIPRAITSEMICLSGITTNKKIVIGDTSTALFNCRTLLPAVRVISIMELIGYLPMDKQTKFLFGNIGIKIPTTLDELDALLEDEEMNLKNKKIRSEGGRIYLRTLKENDATQEYCNWLNDPETHKYLETKKATMGGLRKYIREKNNNPNCLFFGIFSKENNKHIGNIKLEPIDFGNKKATLGILIGDKKYWGKGIGTEAVKLLVDWAFNNLDLEKIDLGVVLENQAAIKVYEKAGFHIDKIKNKGVFMSITRG